MKKVFDAIGKGLAKVAVYLLGNPDALIAVVEALREKKDAK